MANIARIRLPGFWIQNSVVDPDEFEALDEVRPWLANFTAGSSHTPSGFVTVGGSGFQLTGTGHEVAASARLNVQSTGEIRVADGGTIKLNGTGTADIDLKVTSGTALIDAESGSAIRIKSGASLDVFGALAAKSGSTSTWESGSTCTFNSGSTLVIASGTTATLGATMSVPGQISFASGGTLTALSGANVNFNSGSTLNAVGTNNLYNLTLVGASTWITFNTTRSWTRHTMHIALCTYGNHASAGPASADAWVAPSDLGNTPCVRTRDAGNSGDYSLLEFLDLPEGGTVTEVEIDSRGGNSNVPTYPTYQLVRWQTGDGTLSTLSSAVTDIHSSAGNWDTVVNTTTVTPTSTTVIDRAYRYGILITHPYAAFDSFMRVYRCAMTGTATQLKV